VRISTWARSRRACVRVSASGALSAARAASSSAVAAAGVLRGLWRQLRRAHERARGLQMAAAGAGRARDLLQQVGHRAVGARGRAGQLPGAARRVGARGGQGPVHGAPLDARAQLVRSGPQQRVAQAPARQQAAAGEAVEDLRVDAELAQRGRDVVAAGRRQHAQRGLLVAGQAAQLAGERIDQRTARRQRHGHRLLAAALRVGQAAGQLA
jgi:hypothetical protein